MIIVPSAHGVLSAAHDPFIASVVNLTHFNETTAGNLYLNSVGTGNAFSSADSALSTTQHQYNAHSVVMAASGSRAVAASDTDYGFGTGDFTIEWWQWFDDVTGVKEYMDMRAGVSPSVKLDVYTNGSDLRLYVNGADRITGANGTLLATTWQFIALSRVSGSTRFYVGTSGTAAQIGSTYTDANNYGTTSITYGRSSFGVNSASVCYFNEFRVTKGVGRYAGTSCPVPTQAFPNT